ncbi:hypothetical protein [Salinifilum aidingensis]
MRRVLNSLAAFAAFAGVLITVIIGASLAMCWYEHRMLGTRPAQRSRLRRPPSSGTGAPEPAPGHAAEPPAPLAEQEPGRPAPDRRVPGADRTPPTAVLPGAARRITPAASAGVALLVLLLTIVSRSGQAHPLIGTDPGGGTGKRPVRSPARSAAARGAGLRRPR